MQGFTDKALILMPDPEVVGSEQTTYKMKLKTGYNKLVKYCQGMMIDVYVLWSDEIAHSYADEKVNVIRTLTRGDEVFMCNNNVKFNDIKNKGVVVDNYKNVITEAVGEYPIEKGFGVDQRFEIVCKREKYVVKEIIKDFKLIFNIQAKRPVQYRAVTKSDDMRMVVNFDMKTLIGAAEMSGASVSIISVMGVKNANFPLWEWEV